MTTSRVEAAWQGIATAPIGHGGCTHRTFPTASVGAAVAWRQGPQGRCPAVLYPSITFRPATNGHSGGSRSPSDQRPFGRTPPRRPQRSKWQGACATNDRPGQSDPAVVSPPCATLGSGPRPKPGVAASGRAPASGCRAHCNAPSDPEIAAAHRQNASSPHRARAPSRRAIAVAPEPHSFRDKNELPARALRRDRD